MNENNIKYAQLNLVDQFRRFRVEPNENDLRALYECLEAYIIKKCLPLRILIQEIKPQKKNPNKKSIIVDKTMKKMPKDADAQGTFALEKTP